MERQLSDAIRAFAEVLRSNWASVKAVGESSPGRDAEEFASDWAQANWEMVVEAAISSDAAIYLEPYGEGADCNEVGSRVWRPGQSSTHEIRCSPRLNLALFDQLLEEQFPTPQQGILFDQFVTINSDGWYAKTPPFDYALCTLDGKERVVELASVNFVLLPCG